MTYTLYRGNALLGRIETRGDDITMGILIPRDETVALRGETQMHFPAFGGAPASVASMPAEPDLVDGPPPVGKGGPFALKPVTDDMIVRPEDELRVVKGDEPMRVQSVWLQERRYLGDVPPEDRRRVPPGAWRERSYWVVTVFPEREPPWLDDDWSATADDISP